MWKKNKAILERLSGVSNRKAAFITAMTYISADRKIEKTFIGKDEGHILTAFPAGKQNGFGYDPISLLRCIEQKLWRSHGRGEEHRLPQRQGIAEGRGILKERERWN